MPGRRVAEEPPARRGIDQVTDPADGRFLRRAIELGRRGLGRTSPNPPVGAVVVRDGRIVGEGWHRRAGTAHAEVIALGKAGAQAKGATLYCTLEPCVHQGRTPPCAPRVVEAGIARVVLGATDPNPRVRGRGIAALRRAGLEVATGLEAEAAGELIRFFAHRMRTARPFVRLKLAASADGRIATRAGDARWISGPPARRLVHRWRDELDAVLVGVGTVLADDPALTCRRRGGRDPVRVVVDSRLRTPPDASLLGDGRSPVWIATTRAHDRRRAEQLAARGATLLVVPGRRGQVDLGALFRLLAGRDISSVLVEGGAKIAASLLVGGHVDEICWFSAPLLIGGDGVPMVAPIGAATVTQAIRLEPPRTSAIGQDLLHVARPRGVRRSGARGEGRR